MFPRFSDSSVLSFSCTTVTLAPDIFNIIIIMVPVPTSHIITYFIIRITLLYPSKKKPNEEKTNKVSKKSRRTHEDETMSERQE